MKEAVFAEYSALELAKILETKIEGGVVEVRRDCGSQAVLEEPLHEFRFGEGGMGQGGVEQAAALQQFAFGCGASGELLVLSTTINAQLIEELGPDAVFAYAFRPADAHLVFHEPRKFIQVQAAGGSGFRMGRVLCPRPESSCAQL